MEAHDRHSENPDPAAASEEALMDDVTARRWNVLYMLRVSALYHRKRERFFDLCDKLTKAVTIAFGASLFGSLFASALPVVGAAITSLGLFSLVFGYSDRKQAHRELAIKYLNFQAQIEKVGHRVTEAHCDEWEAELSRLNSIEPPALGLLVVLCQNEINVVDGNGKSNPEISWIKRQLANFFDLKVPPPVSAHA